MRIKAPSLKLDMDLDRIILKEGQPIIVSKVGVYEATAVLSRADVRVVLRHLLRPGILIGFLRLALSKGP